MITSIAQRYNVKVLLTGGVIGIAGIWIGVAVFHKRRKARDQKAIAFLVNCSVTLHRIQLV